MKYSTTVAFYLALALLLATARGRSVRALYDVHRDVIDDSTNLQAFPQEVRERDIPNSRENHLENYVKIKASPTHHVNIARGHRLELTCEVDASPPPRIYWVMGENPGRQVEQLERESVAEVSYTEVAREKSSLVIDCVTPLDQGLIHCVGVSADKMVISQPTVLNVLAANGTSAGDLECRGESAAPVITRHRTLYLTETGSTIELPCEAVGKPKPHVHWLRSDGTAPNDPRFDVQPSGSLIISNVNWQDMDEYRCVAKSSLGTAEATTFVYPASKVRNFSLTKGIFHIFTMLKRLLRKAVMTHS